MSKLSFRARALDASKPMPVFRAEEIPDLPDFAAINRAVPQMPTGMEKEEECEHHLQRAISAQQAYGHTGELVIPTPECVSTPESYYNDLYPANYKNPRQLIHVQPFAIEHNAPDYDIDSEDEAWLTKQNEHEALDLTPLRFEEIIEVLEKNSGQQVVDLNEAKKHVKENEVIMSAVYDYWLSKRLKVQHPLIPTVKTEKKDGGSSNNNPYVAFRRRTEKMQTRKNRKNDEASYEKMLKLKRDLTKAVTLLSLVKHREKMKSEHLRLTIDIFDKRYRIGDFSGQVLADVSAVKHIKPSSYLSLNNQSHRPGDKSKDDSAQKKRRDYKKKAKNETTMAQRRELLDHHDYIMTSEDDAGHRSDQEEDDPDGSYAFKRTAGCSYHAPLTDQSGNFAWESPEEGGTGDARHRFSYAAVNSHLEDEDGKSKTSFIGFIRRRIGRGGRIIFDRLRPPPESLGNLPSSDSAIDMSVDEAASDKDFSEDEDGNLVPVVRLPLSDLIRTESCLSREGEAVMQRERVCRSKSNDTEHSSHLSLEPPVSTASLSWIKSHFPSVPSWTSSSLSPGVNKQSSRPSTVDSESAQFAVSAIDAYTGGVTTGVSCINSLEIMEKTGKQAGDNSISVSSNIISNGPNNECGRNNNNNNPLH